MILTLIICTYKRPVALLNLLTSVVSCSIKPRDIIIVDSSPDDGTSDIVSKFISEDVRLNYYKVNEEHRGLTRQRNFGISKLADDTEIVAFLDDDIKVEPDYFKVLLETYRSCPDAIGAGGLDLQNNNYFRKEPGAKYNKFKYYEIDGWVAAEPLRYKARKLFGLLPSLQPGLIPDFSHGRSVLPPTGKIYEVEHFTGMSMSFRMELFSNIEFSHFFEGYGLYEDFDFCVRALKYGKLYINTNAKVWHFHESSGRPDLYKYGKMVIRNGWYVWRVRYPSPSVKSRVKWHATTILLTSIRLMNAIVGSDKKNAFIEFLGRISAWFGVLYNPPIRSE